MKGSISLSANFLVIMIVAIAVLGMGIALSQDMLGGAQETYQWYSQQRRNQLIELMDTGDRVVVPISRASLTPGDYEVFPVLVRNVASTQEFTLIIDSLDIGGCDSDNFVVTIPLMKTEIESSGKEVFEIAIEVPKDSTTCTYAFNVSVRDSTMDTYGAPSRIYIEVP